MSIIAINGSRHQDRYFAEIGKLAHALLDSGFRLVCRQEFLNYLIDKGLPRASEITPVLQPDSAGAPQAVLSLGGDGTLLRTAEWLAGRNFPVLGINTGHLGFLANFRISEIDTLIDNLLHDAFEIDERVILKIDSPDLPKNFWPYALNEVAFLKADTSAMINVHADIDGHFLADFLADGLLVSTPTGSTGYNLSVGGPIMQPDLECWLVSPVAPHSLTMRPIVVSADAPIMAITTSRAHVFRLSLDGRSCELPCGAAVTITKAPFRLKLLRRADDNFASTLRSKLGWASR